ncbi:MAG: hypothetical protein IKW59_02905 [Clostridia bacterium]|nr:hypothetical protein [Clostridia bacterium]
MKKRILLVLTVGLLLCSCSAKNENKEQIPTEISVIKNHFSSIYKMVLANKNNKEYLQTNEDGVVAASVGISLSVSDSENQIINFDRNYYYIKECLKAMENIRVLLSDDGIEAELITGLDNTVNKMVHYMNKNNGYETMRAANDGIYVIGAILQHYENNSRVDMLKLEYCLNLIEIESENKEKLIDAVELTKTVVPEICTSDDEKHKYREQILKSLESIKSASVYSDSRLIKMKVAIMRENLKKITALE